MRFLMTVNGGGTQPDEQMYAEMGRFVEELTRAGVLLATGGLDPGTHVAASGGNITLTDGPSSWTATSADQLGLIAGLLDGSATVPGLSVDTELVSDPTEAGQRRRLLCCHPRRRAQGSGLAVAHRRSSRPRKLVDGGPRIHPARAGRSAHPYAGRYLTELEEIWATQSGHMRVLLGVLLFPYPAASLALVAQIDEFLTAGTPDPGFARVLAERRDTVQLALRSRALPSDDDPGWQRQHITCHHLPYEPRTWADSQTAKTNNMTLHAYGEPMSRL